jgi:nicotinamidase-related amidase
MGDDAHFTGHQPSTINHQPSLQAWSEETRVMLRLPARHLAMHSTCPDDNVEANIAPAETTLEITPRATALVLVDVWNKHHVKSHMERTGQIMREQIAPLLPVARAAGITVVYAPSPEIAHKYPQWQRNALPAAPPDTPNPKSKIQNPKSDWPPADFRRRTGAYSRYARRPGETPAGYAGSLPDWWHWDAIDASITPEADDAVVATGDELHRLLREREILFLLYAGFATNICVLFRDYGIIAMGARGYLPILLRDCTTGIENRDTLADFTTTRFAIQEVERRYYSTLGSDLVRSCEERE